MREPDVPRLGLELVLSLGDGDRLLDMTTDNKVRYF